MIKVAAFTLGIPAALGGLAFAGVSFLAATSSDNPQAGNDTFVNTTIPSAVVGAVGIVMIVGAFFIP